MSESSVAVVPKVHPAPAPALPAVLPPESAAPMRPAGNLFPSLDRLALFERVAAFVVNSREFDKRFKGNGEQAIAKVMVTLLKADSLGVSLNDALEHVYVVDGKTGLSGQLMLRLINERAPGRTFTIQESTDKVCRILMGRPGEEPTQFTFTADRAAQAGLLHYWKDGEKKEQFVWRAYREEMLQWRVIAKAARVLFPEILQGCYLLDELTAGPDLGDAHAPDWAVQQQALGARDDKSNNRPPQSDNGGKSERPKGDPARDVIKALLNQATGIALEGAGAVPADSDWNDRFKDVRHKLWDELCQHALGHIPEGEPEVTPEQLDQMRVYLKAKKRDALLDHVCRLGLIADGKNPETPEWEAAFTATRQQTWEGMCTDIIGQPASPDAPLAEDILDRMVEALSTIQLKLKGDGKT